MKHSPKILALGAVDERGVAGTGGRRPFKAPDPTFRRLDRLTRTLVLAAKACGIESLLTEGEREETALVLETCSGCLESDLRFERGLRAGLPAGALFPYTLPSTCLGDVALRLGLRGPTLSLSIDPSEAGEALREACRLLDVGEARRALVGVADSWPESPARARRAPRAVLALVVAADEPGRAVVPWPDEARDPFTALADACFLGRAQPREPAPPRKEAARDAAP